MYELEPGDRLWPYHTHHANEEWLIVLRGRPVLGVPIILASPFVARLVPAAAEADRRDEG
jgi:hypothetical protein